MIQLATILCLTPGSAVLFVVSHGVSRGGRSSLWATAGILAGNALYFLLSAVGLGAVLLTSYDIFTVIRYAGAAYLIYLGIQTFRGAGLALGANPGSEPASSGWRALARGFALQTANPKAIVFIIAFLPQFIAPRSAVAPQVAILAITSIIIEFTVLAIYGHLAGRAAEVARKSRFVTVTKRASGAMLVAAGTGLAITSNR